MTEELYPVGLKRDGQSRDLIIQWNDGREDRITCRRLRDSCCCATCRAQIEASGKTAVPGAGKADPFRILTPAETRPLEVLGMTPVGNYAYHIEFSDGHNTGIFTFDRLRRLGDSLESDA